MRSGASASDCRPDMVDIDAESVKRLLRCVDDPTQRNTTAAALSKVAAKAEGAQRPAKLALSCLRLPSIYAQAQAAAPPPSRKLAATQRRGSAAPVGALRRVLSPSAHALCRAPTSLPGFCAVPPPNLFPRLPPVYPTSRMADDVLLLLSDHARDFVAWLEVDEPLVRAYTACILANIAFLEPGQQRVLEGKGIAPLVRLLKGKEDKKVTLHSTAAVQNLTYKNTACCQEVIDHGGEKALKKLLQHKSDDVQQFAAGALANLQLYRRKADDDPPSGGAAGGGGRGSSMSRKVAKILRRKNTGGGGGDGSPGGSSAPVPQALQKLSHAKLDDAAATIQACYRGMRGRKDFERHRQRDGRKKGNRYDVFRVNDVRAELSVLPPANPRGGGLPGLGKLPGLMGGGGGGLGPGGPGLSGFNAAPMRAPARLAPLGSIGGPPPMGGGGPGRLPGLPAPGGGGNLPGLLGPSASGGSGLRPPPPGLRLGAMR